MDQRDAAPRNETKTYSDGTQATGPAPLPSLSPASASGSVLIECGIEGLTLRNGDGLRLDLATNTGHVFRDDDAPSLLRGQIPARVTWLGVGVALPDGAQRHA